MMFRDKAMASVLASLIVSAPAICDQKVIGTFKSDSSLQAKDKKDNAEPISTKDTNLESLSEAALEKKIVDILNKNPSIIMEALQKFSEQQERAQQEKTNVAIMQYKSEITDDSKAAVLGKKDADIKLIVFVDPNCPHCRPFTQALNKAKDDFPNIAFYVRHWPILGKDSDDVVRGLWAIKLQGQDKLSAAIKAIATSDERYTGAKLLSWAQDNKLDVEKYKKDVDSDATQKVVEDTVTLAKSKLVLPGTPSSILVTKKGIQLVTPMDEKSLVTILQNASKA